MISKLPFDQETLENLKKGDPRKVALAWLLRIHTMAGNEWIAQRLRIGYPGSVSRLIGQAQVKKENEEKAKFKNLEKLLK